MSGYDLKHIEDIKKLAGDKQVALVEDGPINYIVLNRPPFNTLNQEMLEEFDLCLDKVEAKLKDFHEEQVLITVGQGEKCYSSGFDMKWWPQRESNNMLGVSLLDKILLRILKFQLPTMAILNGHCIAGGLFLSMTHERRIIKDGNWVLTANEVPMGIIVPSGF